MQTSVKQSLQTANPSNAQIPEATTTDGETESQSQSADTAEQPQEKAVALKKDAESKETILSKETEDTEETETPNYFPSKFTKSVADLAKREQAIEVDKLPPTESLPDIDSDHVLYNKAVFTIKNNLTERSVLSQFDNVWIMYEQCHRRLITQNATLQKYRRVIAKQEEDAQNDKRVMQAIYYADKHRRERKELEKLNSELERELKERDEETLPYLEDRLRTTTRELDKLKAQTKAHNKLQERFMDLEFSFNKCQTKVTTINQDAVERADSKAREHRIEIKEMQQKMIAEKNAVLLENSVAAGVLNRKIERMSQEKQQMYHEIQALQRGLSNSDHTIMMCEDQLKKSRAKVQALESVHHSLEVQLDVARQNASQYEATKTFNEDALRQAKKDLQEMKKTVEDNRIEISKLNFDLNNVRKTNRLLEDQKKKIQDSLTAQRNRISQIVVQSSFDKKDIDKLNAQLNKSQKDIKEMTTQCEVLASKLNKVRGELSHSEDARKACGIETTFCANMTIALERDIHHKQGIINNFVKQADKLCKHVVEVHNALKSCEETNMALKQWVEGLEKKQDELEVSLKEEESLSFNMSRKNATQQVKMGILRDMLQQKEEELNRNVIQIQNLVYESNKYLTQNNMLNNEMNRVAHNLSVKTRECKLLEQSVQKMKRDAHMKQQAINHLNVKVNEGKEELKNQLLENHDMERMRNYQQGKADMKDTELKLLQERMAVSESRLSLGTSVLINRTNDVRILIVEVKNLRRKLRLRDEDVKNHRTLKESYVGLGRQHTKCKAKLAALEKMQQTRIHPMRHLKAVNPSSYELHIKVNYLTQQLIRKTLEVTDKEKIIMEKNKVFLDLKGMLMRRGNSDDLNKEIWDIKKIVQEKERQIKSLEAELSTSLFTASEAKKEMNYYKQQLEENKKELLKQKRIIQRRKYQCKATTLALPKFSQKKSRVPKLPPLNLIQPQNQTQPLNLL